MDLINLNTKKIMEGCKERARGAGLRFQDESLEYIVTNRDLLELSPKGMIPTLYDYWVHDVEVLREKGRYELYPGNPYETVINTRPAISFYNDNNPDWLNVMIFYHVLAHIDFFQNNLYFRHTWDYDFTARALSDKRAVAKLRAEKGRWVDYIIEFTRGIDNLVGYHETLSRTSGARPGGKITRLDYYFDLFLQKEKNISTTDYLKEIDRYNRCISDNCQMGEESFFSEVALNYPEFETLYGKYLDQKKEPSLDLIQYLMSHSPFLNREQNLWMKIIMEVVRNTAMFFQPQIRTKIMNEGWASFWHETLFLQDDRIGGHEVDYARVNAGVTAMPRVGLNPYALGMRLFYEIEERADKGRYSFDFEKIKDAEKRKHYDRNLAQGRKFIFDVRENLSDFLFIKTFVDQDFVDRHKLFVAGRRMNRERMVWEYYVKSRKAEDYRNMLFDALYHPPHITIDVNKSKDGELYLIHHFEDKPLVQEFIPNTMLGVEYLWGGGVKLETHEVETIASAQTTGALGGFPIPMQEDLQKEDVVWRRVVYQMKDKKLSREVISSSSESPAQKAA